MPEVFISYASEKIEIAHEVKRRFNQEIIDSFYDQDMKEAPDVKEWRNFLRDKVLECSCMVVIITDELLALRKDNVIWEWSIMDGRRDTNIIIPLVFGVSFDQLVAEDSRLKDFQGISFEGLQDKDTWNTLFNRIRAINDNYARDPYVAQAELLLHSPKPEDRQAAQQYLVYFDHPDAKNALLRAVNSNNPEVSLVAAVGLRQREPLSPDPRSLKGLTKVIIGHTAGRTFFHDALKELCRLEIPEVVNAYREILDNIEGAKEISAVMQKLKDCRVEGVSDLLIELLEGSTGSLTLDQLSPVIAMLQDNHLEQLRPYQQLFLDLLRAYPNHHSTKGRVAEILGYIGDPKEVIEPLVGVMNEHKDTNNYRANLVINRGCIIALSNLGEAGNRKLRELWHQSFYHYIKEVLPRWRPEDWRD